MTFRINYPEWITKPHEVADALMKRYKDVSAYVDGTAIVITHHKPQKAYDTLQQGFEGFVFFGGRQ